MKKFTILIAVSLLGLVNSCSNAASPDSVNSSVYAASDTASPKLSFVSNQDYLPALVKLLQMPDIKTVDIVHYNFFTENGGASQVILDNLIRLKNQGAKLRIILEGVKADPNKRNSLTLKKLQDAGITDVKLSTGHTTHDKAICINSRFLLLGSTNWTRTSMEKNNETDALVDSEIIGKGFISYVDGLWNNTGVMQPGKATDGGTDLLSDNAFYDELKGMISRAQNSLDIGTYFLAYRKGKEADDIKVKELLDMIITKYREAKSRGADFKVRFFVDNNGISPQDYQNFTVKGAVNARDYLAKNGITEFYFDKYEQISHCKFVIKDAAGPAPEVIFGSTNLYKDDFDSIHQLNVRTNDSSVVNSFLNYMNERLKTATKEPVVPTQAKRMSEAELSEAEEI